VCVAGPAANFFLAGAPFGPELGGMSAMMALFNMLPWRLGKMDSDGLQALREIRQWCVNGGAAHSGDPSRLRHRSARTK
jgi:hypothetical protein